jgi:cation diffusion facilitator CzcD-associated flavoprotein CzcO
VGQSVSKELIIIGAGPAGLKAAEEAQRYGIDYIVLEKGSVGHSWRELRPNLLFLSPCHPQRDWTSLSPRFPIWKMPVRRPYCTAGQFADYLTAFNDHFKLNVKTGHAVSDVNHDGSVYQVRCGNNTVFKAPILLMATGIFGNPFFPPIPGAENNPHVMHSHYYQGPTSFEKQVVLIIGAGNSAAETAIDLAGTSMVYLVSRKDLQYFSDTKKLYHIRGISESFLKELIAMEIIRYRAFQDIQKIDGNLVYFKEWKLKADTILFATGYHADIRLLKNFKLRVNKSNYPEVSYSGESIQYPNLFFGGPLSYQTDASLVIHGFIKNIPRTVERIAQKLKEEFTDRAQLDKENAGR